MSPTKVLHLLRSFTILPSLGVGAQTGCIDVLMDGAAALKGAIGALFQSLTLLDKVTWTALLTACAVAKPKKREEHLGFS